MTQDSNTPNPAGPLTPDSQISPPAPKPRKRRKWPFVVGGILLLLILLALLAPTIASTGAVRSIVISKINNNLNGTLAIADWSIGWTSGVTLNGLKIDDEKGRLVAEIGSVKVPVSLIGAARGNYDLGEIVIDNPAFNFERYPDGTTNVDHLVKEQATTPAERKPKTEKESKLPDVRGKITVNNLHGTIADQANNTLINIDPSTVSINIPSINSPIENNIKLAYRVGNAAAGTVNIVGTVDAVENNVVDVNKLSADQKIEVTNADLVAASAFLKKNDPSASLAGIANGSLQIRAKGLNDAAAQGQFLVSNFAYTGASLKGDTFKSSKIAIPIDVTTSPKKEDTQVNILSLKIDTDQIVVAVSGHVTKEALQNLAVNKAPGSEGDLSVAINSKDLVSTIKSMPHAVPLQNGVTIDAAKFAMRVDLNLAADKATVKLVLDVDASGTNAGKPIKLDPVHLDTSLTAMPTAGAIPDLRDIAINLTSAFATA